MDKHGSAVKRGQLCDLKQTEYQCRAGKANYAHVPKAQSDNNPEESDSAFWEDDVNHILNRNVIETWQSSNYAKSI